MYAVGNAPSRKPNAMTITDSGIMASHRILPASDAASHTVSVAGGDLPIPGALWILALAG